MRKGKLTAKFRSLKCVLIEDTKGFMLPEKFQEEMGSRTGGNHVQCQGTVKNMVY